MLKLTHSTLIVGFVLALLIFGPRLGNAASVERLIVIGGALTDTWRQGMTHPRMP